jgi:hypothetical protein
MEKPNLEEMTKELHPGVCYDGVNKLDALLHDLSKANSNFTMSKTELIKKLSIVFYEEQSKTFPKEATFDNHFDGLQKFLNKKLDLIVEFRKLLDSIERESVIQGEFVGLAKHRINETLK